MKKITKNLFACLCSLATVSSLYAERSLINSNFTGNTPDNGCYAVEVVEFVQGKKFNGQDIEANRSNSNLALGLPDKSNASGGFVSLGKNGHITLKFGGAVFNAPGFDINVYETSFSGNNCGRSDDEKALIELSQDGVNWVTYGEVCRDGKIDIEGLGLDYVTQIRITNLTSSTASPDGYDVDGVEAVNGCQEIPTVCYGSRVVEYSPSISHGPIAPSRMDPTKGLGEPQGGNTNHFVSLGYGGHIIIGFDDIVKNEPGNDFTIVETTNGNSTFATYPESADVFVTQNGIDFYFVGAVYTKQSASFDISAAVVNLPYITQIKLVDTTPAGSVSDDGFDLDGIIAINGCHDAPEITIGQCNATDYFNYVQGKTKNGGNLPAIRTNPNNALGTPEGTDTNVFTTLGYGGSITLAFDGSIMNGEGADIKFIETSFNQSNGCNNYPEFADIYVSFDNYSWHFAGTVCKENNTIDISDAGNFEYINFVKVVNNNSLSTTPDGYDLDGVIALHNCIGIPNDDERDNLGLNDSKGSVLDVTSYPNPTNGLMKISFTANESSNAVAEVYDLFGRTVAKVFNQEVASGEQYNMDFDGSHLPNGVYIYKISINNTTVAKKFSISR